MFRPIDRPLLPRLLGKGGETALVQADLDVAVSDAIADFSRFATGGQ